MELKTRGFALSARPLAESDRLITLFTLHAGLVRASVRGVRKAGSKLAPALELMTESDLVLNRRAGGDLFRLTQAKVISSRAALKEDLASISALQVLADVVGQAVPAGEAHPEVYALVLEVLAEFPKAKGSAEREMLLAAFVLHLLEGLGYPLELSRCAECGHALTRSPAALVPHRGGALCAECAPGNHPLKLAAAPRAVAEKLKQWPIERALVLKAGPSVSRTVFKAALEYLEQTLEHPLKSYPYYLQVVGLKGG